MNLLIDRPPKAVIIGGTKYEINTDFRASILFELLMQDDDIEDVKKLYKAVDIYFPYRCPQAPLKDILKAILWFYGCGRSDKERNHLKENTDDEKSREENPKETETSAPSYSFDYDDEYIYAAFRQQYGIILTDLDYLHWWEFRAMFKGLDHNCVFAKIMGYRAARITKEMSKSEKAFLRKMKSIHALPISEKEQKRANALADALMNGGNVDQLLGYGEIEDG